MRVPFLNFQGGPGTRGPYVPGPGVLVPLLHQAVANGFYVTLFENELILTGNNRLSKKVII